MSHLNQCYNCAYRGNIPGDAHICCNFNWKLSQHPMPTGDAHGIKRGWFMFPFNYDPAWMTNPCPEQAQEADPQKTKKTDLFESLVSLFARLK